MNKYISLRHFLQFMFEATTANNLHHPLTLKELPWEVHPNLNATTIFTPFEIQGWLLRYEDYLRKLLL